MPGAATSEAEITIDLSLDAIKHPERYPLKSKL
jgi:hypothetical protein